MHMNIGVFVVLAQFFFRVEGIILHVFRLLTIKPKLV